MCGPRQPGSEENGCRGAVRTCDFCGGLGIVEVAVAERYRKGRELGNIRVRKLSLTQEQLARVLRVPGIRNGEQVEAIEHGRGPNTGAI